jgi:hypothetical protein
MTILTLRIESTQGSLERSRDHQIASRYTRASNRARFEMSQSTSRPISGPPVVECVLQPMPQLLLKQIDQLEQVSWLKD